MNPADKHLRREEDDPSAVQQSQFYQNHKSQVGAVHDAPDRPRRDFTLLVAGCKGGKTSFLRLLLDTSIISPTATQEQLASVAKFVQGCNSHTSGIRHTSIDINLNGEGNAGDDPVELHLVDTAALDFPGDEKTAEWRVSEILRHVDTRFADGVDMDWSAHRGDRFVHLCIYFLDPDQIVPPAVPGAVPLVPRTRNNSFSHTEPDPVILEPPLTTNPLLLRPTLPAAEIETIRRLSSRVNVLPVISRADVLSNDRLAAVKVAIRRDLAEAGIGFGIFDVDHPYQTHQPEDSSGKSGDGLNGYNRSTNGTGSSNTTPPTSPVAPVNLRLPYALISPDIYSHSDGVARPMPSRHELAQQYTPSHHHGPGPRIPRGKYIRSYRWGALDILDPSHSDFITLRAAIFHHMETLQKYTREYLFDRFRAEYLRQQQPSSRHSLSHRVPHGGPISHGSRPILAIDTAPPPTHRQPPLPPPRDVLNAEPNATSSGSKGPEPSSTASARGTPRGGSAKQRTKKITVACNFCRSRKLKCDGQRPACGQCVKRGNPCDYVHQNKRRATIVPRKGGDESESDSSEERSVEPNEPSLSPQIPAQPLSRNVHLERARDVHIPPPPPRAIDTRDDVLPGPSSMRPRPQHPMNESRSLFPDNELPHIATLSLPEPSPSTPGPPLSAPSLPPIRPANEQQAAQRKRSATVPGKSSRQSTSSGPKVVACNFCRARKTKCDGAHPACASCARRSLPCNYVHDSGNGGQGQKKGRRASVPKPATDSPHSLSPPSSRLIPTPSSGGGGIFDPRAPDHHRLDDLDLKRSIEYSDINRPSKKMRMEGTSNNIP